MELVELTLRVRIENGQLEITVLDDQEVVGRQHRPVESEVDAPLP